MTKSLIEITAEIVAAQASLTALSPAEMATSLRTVFEALQTMQQTSQKAQGQANVTADPQASIQHHQVVCLECGEAFTLLSNRHLALHELTPRTYKQKHGIRMTQALSARALTAKRRKLAKDLGMGGKLAAWRAHRQRQAEIESLRAHRG